MIDWKTTSVHRSETEMHHPFSTVSHITSLENALSIVRNGCIRPHPEKESGNPLDGKNIDVIWFSPNDWQLYKPNTFGCVAFEFNLDQLIEQYGEAAFGLGVARHKMKTSRFLLSYSDHSFDKYPTNCESGPWMKIDDEYVHRKGCVLHFAVESNHVSLGDVVGMRFVDQRGGTRQSIAASKFLARCVGEQLPAIRNFCELTQDNGLHVGFCQAVDFLWNKLPRKLTVNGTYLSSDPISKPLARAYLDRWSRAYINGRYGKEIEEDSKKIAALFSSYEELVITISHVIADWANIEDVSKMKTACWTFDE